jgi:transposase
MAQRVPLGAITGNRGYNQELSVWDRAQISAYKAIGLSNEQIGGRVFCSPSTVQTTLRLNPLRNNGKTRPRSGRPSTLSRTDRRNILRIIRRNPKMTYAILKLEARVEVSRTTIYRLFKEKGITNWLAKKRSLLTPEVVAKRFAWAKQLKNWIWNKWRKIIWSDECSFEKRAEV